MEQFSKKSVRNRVLAGLVAAAMVAGSTGASTAYAGQKKCPLAPAVKNVILFIGDGMQLQHEMAASRYLHGNDLGMSWMKFPYRGQVATWDVTTYDRYAYAADPTLKYDADSFDPILGYDPAQGGSFPHPLDPTNRDDYFLTKLPTATLPPAHPATDSASAGTALATGVKTDDGNLAWLPGDPADGALETIAEMLRKKRGKAIGVVSTVPFNHATPAAFVSHNVSRNNYYTGLKGYTGLGIADEIVTKVKPDVVIGGGHPLLDNPSYDTNKGFISKQLHDALKSSSDYVFAERTAGVDGGQALLDAAAAAAASKKKLFGLFGGKGGNFEYPVPSDTPGAPSVVRGSTENPSFAQAVKAALTVLAKDRDGFFLMAEQGDIDWANHGNDFKSMVGTVADLNEGIKAAMDFVDQPGDDIDWSNTLIMVTSDHGNSYMRLNDTVMLGKGDLPAQVGTSYPDGEVAYGSGGHTNELVTLYAIGGCLDTLRSHEGKWYPGTTIIDNTQLFKTMKQCTMAPAGLQR
jgi:alkaline phosphatase